MSIDQHAQLESDVDEQILNARITHDTLSDFFQRLTSAFYFVQAVPLPLIMIAVMWSQIDHRLLIGWGLLVMISIYLRYRLAVSFFQQPVSFIDAEKWGHRFTLASLYSSSLWASAAFLFFVPDSIEHQVFICVFSVSLSIGAIVAGIYWLPSFYVFALPIIGALATRLLMEGSLAYGVLALFLVWMFLNAAGMARVLHKTVRSEMRLRHESALLNESLKEKTEEAQQAVRAKSKFLAVASHDLRQPLHALSLFLDVLKDSKSKQERDGIFPRIDLSLNALRKLFDALMDVSRLDAGVIKADVTHFDVSEMLLKLAQEYESAATHKHLKIRTHLRQAIVVSDEMLLERVLRNLISNAIRYTEQGSILLSVRTRGEDVLVQVWDTGIGIADNCRDEIFIEFRQLNNTSNSREEGLGLGLSLVKRLCRLLNHPFWFRSQLGRGSVFSVQVSRGSLSLVNRHQPDGRLNSWDLSGRRVLVIDDEQDILIAQQALLSKWGCEVVTAQSQEEAESKLAASQMVPELIISDLRLSDNKTGIDAMDRIRKQFGESIPGILITGDTGIEQLKLANLSQYEVLQKPVLPAHLRGIIQYYLTATKE